MKAILPLLAWLLLLPFAAAAPSSWVSLTGIGDEVVLAEGDTALIVAVSKPAYFSIQVPHDHRRSVRLRPVDYRFLNGIDEYYYDRREVTEVGWNRPFPIVGPCTIRLGTPALVTMRVIGPGAQR